MLWLLKVLDVSEVKSGTKEMLSMAYHLATIVLLQKVIICLNKINFLSLSNVIVHDLLFLAQILRLNDGSLS